MNIIFNALGGTRYARMKIFGGKHEGGLAPLYSCKIKKLREKEAAHPEAACRAQRNQRERSAQLELGDRKPKKEVLERIAMALRVRPEYLSAPEFGPSMEFFYAILENDELYGYTITGSTAPCHHRWLHDRWHDLRRIPQGLGQDEEEA